VRKDVHFELEGQVAEDGAVVPGHAAGDEGEDSPLFLRDFVRCC
jgi:hypothetical protein